MPNIIPIRVMILFPYFLPENDHDRRKILSILQRLVQAVQGPSPIQLHTSAKRPVMVVNRITQRSPWFREAMQIIGVEADKWEFVYTWSVDTCQDWLGGWGKIIDDWREDPRQKSLGILQIPGDLRDIGDSESVSTEQFLKNLEDLAHQIALDRSDFMIGGYELISKGGKFLIDAYGTFPLLYNWFPTVASQIREKRITSPRSEFLAGRVEFFDEMLIKHRRFAYEQTTVFLINALLATDTSGLVQQGPRVGQIDLGKIQDHTGDRGFREAIDQLERMERMMRLLWRGFHGGNAFDVDRYSLLDERSAAIRAAAVVTFRNFLQPTGL